VRFSRGNLLYHWLLALQVPEAQVVGPVHPLPPHCPYSAAVAPLPPPLGPEPDEPLQVNGRGPWRALVTAFIHGTTGGCGLTGNAVARRVRLAIVVVDVDNNTGVGFLCYDCQYNQETLSTVR
jgi:hypothetical protein